jgi:apolipoprotein N-acyltransferase
MHSQNATFRAIENGYSLVRQASNGLAMTVDYQGHVLAASDSFVTDQQTMIAFVPVKGVQTLYTLVGDLFVWLCIAGLLLLSGLTVFNSFKRPFSISASSSEVETVDLLASPDPENEVSRRS